MKKLFIVLFVLAMNGLFAQTSDDVLNLLIANKTISQQQADSLRADAAIKKQTSEANKKSFFATAAKQIQLSGFTQLRYQNQDEPGKIDGFDLRRARLDIKGNVTPAWTYKLQFELAGTPKLLDAYAEYKFADYLSVTAGQIKTAISLENITSTGKLESIDVSQVVDALTSRGKDVIGNHNGLDIGVQIGGNAIKIKDYTLLEYRLGVYNGAGINVIDNNESKDIGGRVVLQAIKGLKIGGSYYNAYAGIGTTTTSVTTSTISTKTTYINQIRNRYGFELSYDWNNLSLRGEYLKGQDAHILKDGYYAQIGYYVLPKKLQVVAKYDYYDLNISKTDDIVSQYAIMLNYNFNSLARIQTGYYFRDKDQKGPQIDNGYNIGVVQLQIGF